MAHKDVVVKKIPPCDLCLPHGKTVPAYADARMMMGPWAGKWTYCCADHFEEYGCELGLGHGQRLIERTQETP